MTNLDPTTRGHRGLIAVAVVIGSAIALWFATVALVRSTAHSRIDEELEFLSAAVVAGSPQELATLDAGGDALDHLRPIANRLREVAARDGAHAEWLPALCAAQPNFAEELERASASERQPVDAYVAALFDPGVSHVPRASVACKRALFTAWAEFARGEIATCRVVCELPWSASSIGDCADIEVRGPDVGRVLALSAVASGTNGDGESARRDLERMIALRARFDRVANQQALSDQGRVFDQLGFALEQLLSLRDAPRELRELDAALAAIDVEGETRRALMGSRRNRLAYDRSRAAWDTGAQRLMRWLEWPRELAATGAALALAHEGDAFAARRFADVFTDPAFANFVARSDERSFADLHAPDYLVEGARASAQLVLIRAALRARFDGAEAANAFLATQRDPFTGGAIFTRTTETGAWTAWCSGAPGVIAAAELPDRTHDVAWPPRE